MGRWTLCNALLIADTTGGVPWCLGHMELLGKLQWSGQRTPVRWIGIQCAEPLPGEEQVRQLSFCCGQRMVYHAAFGRVIATGAKRATSHAGSGIFAR